MTSEKQVLGSKQRCIHIFPRFDNNHEIDAIREAFDTLYKCIEPHITLVFPFESSLTKEEIASAVRQVLTSENTFSISTTDITAVESHGFYLFLNIGEGKKRITELHYKLHTGILRPFQSPWTLDGSYEPHITIGRFETKDEMLTAFDNLQVTDLRCEVEIDRIYVEVIGDNDESIIESIIKFGES